MVGSLQKKKRDVIIVCEDTYGLDVYLMIDAINSQKEDETSQYNVVGFLNDDPVSLASCSLPVPILGKVKDWCCEIKATYIIAIRRPDHKRLAVGELKSKGAVFETIIAPWVQQPVKFEHGEGCIIANYNFKYNSIFGNFVIMDTCMCESVEIGDYSTLCPFVNITSASIGSDVYIESHAAIVSRRKIRNNVHIYPGSIVMSNIKEGMSVAGIPASKNIRKWEKTQDE